MKYIWKLCDTKIIGPINYPVITQEKTPNIPCLSENLGMKISNIVDKPADDDDITGRSFLRYKRTYECVADDND